jgi:LysM repeat protein
MSPVIAGQVEFVCEDPPLSSAGWIGDGPITPSGGYGGWTEVDRPKRISITEWAGSKGYKLSIPVLFDGFASGTTVEPQIAALERMARQQGGNEEPPVVHVVTVGSRPRTPSVDWVIADIAWGDAIYNAAGLRTRQIATVEVWQYIGDETIITLARKRRKKKGKGGKKGSGKKGAANKTYKVKAGDTLSEIAARELGSAKRWREIAKLNNIRDPRNIRKGQELRMP